MGLCILVFPAHGASETEKTGVAAGTERLFIVALIGGTENEDSYAPANIAKVFFQQQKEGSGGDCGFRLVIERSPEPASEEQSEALISTLSQKGVLAAVCSARGISAFHVSEASRKGSFPVIMLYSEEIPLGPDHELPCHFLFSLDFDTSFRPQAIARWAKDQPLKNWTIFMDHLDAASTSSGTSTAKALSDEGVGNRTLASAAGNDQRMYYSLRKSLDDGSSHILSWLSPLRTLKMSSLLRSIGDRPAELVYGREPADALREREGIVLFSQDPYIPIQALSKGSVYSRFLENDAVRPVALKTILACQWLYGAASSVPAHLLDSKTLSEAMEHIDRLEAFGFGITLSGKKHRPAEKDIYVLTSANGRWKEIRRMSLFLSPEGKYFIDRKTGGTSSGNP